jgi:hypothetical protein
MTDSFVVQAIRDRVRADRHGSSFPLIVIGAVGFHYASFQLSGWIPPLYGLPLAFVVLWGLQWRHERLHGVGPGDDDVLAVAFSVFVVTSMTLSTTWPALLPGSTGDYHVVWLLGPTAAGLVAIGLRQHSRMLAGCGVGLVVMCALGDAARDSSLQLRWNDYGANYQTLLPQLAFLAATVAGLVRFRAETLRQR